MLLAACDGADHDQIAQLSVSPSCTILHGTRHSHQRFDCLYLMEHATVCPCRAQYKHLAQNRTGAAGCEEHSGKAATSSAPSGYHPPEAVSEYRQAFSNVPSGSLCSDRAPSNVHDIDSSHRSSVAAAPCSVTRSDYAWDQEEVSAAHDTWTLPGNHIECALICHHCLGGHKVDTA